MADRNRQGSTACGNPKPTWLLSGWCIGILRAGSLQSAAFLLLGQIRDALFLAVVADGPKFNLASGSLTQL